jgi:hypothetical protein
MAILYQCQSASGPYRRAVEWRPVAEVAKETLAEDFGVSEDRIRIWLKQVDTHG